MAKILSNGNLALVNGAVVWAVESAGTLSRQNDKILFAAGYPITPVNEVTEYFSRIAGQVNASFIQAESEIAAGNTDAFYLAKLQTARFYFAKLLPETASLLKTARVSAKVLMDTEAVFA